MAVLLSRDALNARTSGDSFHVI